MPNPISIIATMLVAVVPCVGQVPSLPPKPDYRLIEDFSFPTDPAARAAWKSMWGGGGVSVIKIDGRNVLKMPCSFKGTTTERASWDRSVSLDLAACQGIQFRLHCPDASPISSCTCYFQSGEGWYAAGFSAASTGGWQTITIDKDATRIEDTPAGWGQIKTIRISAWRGKDVDTTLYLADLGLLGADAPIAIVRAESAFKTAPSEAKSIRTLSQAMGRCLSDLGLAHCTISDLDLTAKRLEGKTLIILPHNPAMPDKVADEIAGFLERGGKLICFYSLHTKLRTMVGIGGGQHIKQTRPGHFASMHISPEALAGAPPIVQQRSWNISEAKPVEGKSRVLARWYDDQDKPTGHAAIVGSDNCIQMTHVLLEDDAPNKRRMLLAMVGRFMPEAWELSIRRSVERIGRIGSYRDFDHARQTIRRMAARNQRVLEMMDKATDLRGRASSLCSAGNFPEAISAADEAYRLVLDGHLAAQTPLKGEHRAFWCHSAFGVSGMTWDEAIKTLADNGFTAILPNMLWGGTAYYKSRILPVADAVKEKGDQIAQCLAACKKYGVACHVWKVNYNMSGRAPKSFAEQMRRQGRTQVRFNGKPEARWLCPSHPENQKLEIDSMVEVAAKYDVHGIHFDYIRYPGAQGCFCSGCRERFEKAIDQKVKNWPNEVRRKGKLNDRWLDFRRDQITTVVAGVAKAARQARPTVKMSAAVFNDWPTHRNTVGQDWKLWCEKGYLDFVCPMNYTSDNAAFEKLIERQLVWAGKVPCYPGIGFSVWRPQPDVCKLIDQINITRRLKTGGFTVFNYSVNEARQILPMCGKGITQRQ